MKRAGWYFLSAAAVGDPARGWWCFDVDGYSISIGAWPTAAAAPRKSAAVLTYKIVRTDGAHLLTCKTKFEKLSMAQRYALAALREILQKSLSEVESALADEYFTFFYDFDSCNSDRERLAVVRRYYDDGCRFENIYIDVIETMTTESARNKARKIMGTD